MLLMLGPDVLCAVCLLTETLASSTNAAKRS